MVFAMEIVLAAGAGIASTVEREMQDVVDVGSPTVTGLYANASLQRCSDATGNEGVANSTSVG